MFFFFFFFFLDTWSLVYDILANFLVVKEASVVQCFYSSLDALTEIQTPASANGVIYYVLLC